MEEERIWRLTGRREERENRSCGHNSPSLLSILFSLFPKGDPIAAHPPLPPHLVSKQDRSIFLVMAIRRVFALFYYWVQFPARVSSPTEGCPFVQGPSCSAQSRDCHLRWTGWSFFYSWTSAGSWRVLYFSASSVLIHVEICYVCQDTRKKHVWKLLLSSDFHYSDVQHTGEQTDEFPSLSIMCMYLVDQLQPTWEQYACSSDKHTI